jgi:hypothetical protein
MVRNYDTRVCEKLSGSGQGTWATKKASVTFRVPQTTTERKVKCANENPNKKLKISLGPKSDFLLLNKMN